MRGATVACPAKLIMIDYHGPLGLGPFLRFTKSLGRRPYEASMFANGFARKTLVSLIGAGLATTQRENLKAGSRSLGRVRITEAGRQRRLLNWCLRQASLDLAIFQPVAGGATPGPSA
jgi:hypothetical protein